MNKNEDVKNLAQSVLKEHQTKKQGRQFILWILALVVGAALGWLGIKPLNELFNFIATVFTRLFQFIAVPTIALAVITTLAALGSKKETGRIFAHAVVYTLLTTVFAAGIGLAMYLWVTPGNLPTDLASAGASSVPQKLGTVTYYDHILNVIPNNILQPFLSGNVLAVMLIAASFGLGLAFMPKTENREVLLKGILGFQELLFTLIKALLAILPVGILAFAGQLSAQIEAGVIVGALGKYTLVIMASNGIQFFLVLPLFLLARGLNPIDVFKKMSPAIAVALFTKSSAGTLPVTLASADHQHERMRSLHTDHFALRHAECGDRAFDDDHAHMAHCRSTRSCRQCRCTDGMLLPDAFSHEWYRRADRHHGPHPSDLYDHRHDRDSRECLV